MRPGPSLEGEAVLEIKAGSEADVDRTSGYLMRRYDVSARTLRLYEENGLLAPQRVGSIRLFSADDILRLELILTGKKLGLPLKDIAAIVRSHETRPCMAPTNARALDLAAIQRRLSRLEAQKAGVEAAIEKLNEQLTDGETPVPEDGAASAGA